MPPRYFPTRGHLLLCQGPNCQARGARLLHTALWNALEKGALAYYKTGGTVRLTESGCLGACAAGPTLCVYRERGGSLEQGWYGAVDFTLARRVAQAVQDETDLPGEGRYGPDQ
jgi:(2Fe-2S) ferredoxin